MIKLMEISNLTIVSLLLLALVAVLPPVDAQATTLLYVDPAENVFYTNTTLVMSEFKVYVKIADVTNMYAYEFKLRFNNDTIKLVKAVRPPGHFMEPVIDPGNQFVAKWLLNAGGGPTWQFCHLAFTLLAPEPPKKGSGVLVELTFQIIKEPPEGGSVSSPLDLYDTKLADDKAAPIPHTAVDGSYKYISHVPPPPPPPPPPTAIYVYPVRIVNVDLTPCQNFTVNVDIVNAENVYAFEFKLSFNPMIVEALHIDEGGFLSNVGSTSVLIKDIDNTQGYLRFSVKLLSPPGASGNGTLATVTFHVVGFGVTSLSLSETVLKDPEGKELFHTVKHGLFSNVLLAIECVVDFVPYILNLGVKGAWLSGYIELPEGYNVANIQVASILLNDTVPVNAAAPTKIGDHDGDGIQDLMVNFNRTQVSRLIIAKGITTGDVALNLTGYLTDGTPFKGIGVIKVRMSGDINMDRIVDIFDLTVAARAFGTRLGHPRWNPAADENEDGIVDVFDLVLILIFFGYKY